MPDRIIHWVTRGHFDQGVNRVVDRRKYLVTDSIPTRLGEGESIVSHIIRVFTKAGKTARYIPNDPRPQK